jgi:hypothetical protein
MFIPLMLALIAADVGDVVAISGAAALRTSPELVSNLVLTVDPGDGPWLARVLEERSGLLYVERIVNDATLCDDAIGHVRLRAWVSANDRQPLLAAPLVYAYDDGTRLELPAGRVVRAGRVRVMGSYEVPLPRTATARLQLRESELGQLPAQDGALLCLADADRTAATLDGVPLHRLEEAASRGLAGLGFRRALCGHASTPERLRIADSCGALTVATTAPHAPSGGFIVGGLGSDPPDAQVAVYFATGGVAGSAALPASSLLQGPRGCGALDDYVLCRKDGAPVDVDALWLPVAAPDTPARQRTFDTGSLPREAHGLVVLAGLDHRGQVQGATLMTQGAVAAPIEAAVLAAVRSSTWTPAFHRGKAVDTMHRIVLDLREPQHARRVERALSDPRPTPAAKPAPQRTGPCGLPALPLAWSSALRSRVTPTPTPRMSAEAPSAPTRAPQAPRVIGTPTSPASLAPATSPQGGCTFDSDCGGSGTCVRAMGHVGECREVVRSNGMPAQGVNPQPSTCSMDSDCGSFGRCERVGGGYFCVR